MADGAIDGIKGVTRGISDAAYQLATGKTKKIKLADFMHGHGSMPIPQQNANMPTIFGYGFKSSDVAGTGY